MCQQRLVAVDRLQHQEVGDLGRGAAAGRRHAAAERFATLMQQPDQLRHERRQPGRGARVQHGRDEAIVEDHLLVRPALDDVRQRHAAVCRGDVARQQQPRAQACPLRAPPACRTTTWRPALPTRRPRAGPVRPRPWRGRPPARRRAAAAPPGRRSDRAPAPRHRSAAAADRHRASGTACRQETRRRRGAGRTCRSRADRVRSRSR